MNVYIIDNYDSFTYNLYQFIGEILSSEKRQGRIDDFTITVKRNDETSLEEIIAAEPDRLIISPGPGTPDDPAYFGVCAQVIRELGPKIPLLGVCLGMQGIVSVFGGKVIKAPLPMHGKISGVAHDNQWVFANTPQPLDVMRYHSLIAAAETLPSCLKVTAAVGDLPVEAFDDLERVHKGGDFEIMAVQHKDYPIYGIQFHPESFATEGGRELIRNFLFRPAL